MTLKLSEKQLEQAYRLALQVGRCEMAKDEEGQAMVRTGLYASTEIPVSRDVVIAAAKADIARCQEELTAMGISLMPSVEPNSVNSKKNWCDIGPIVGSYFGSPGYGAAVGGAMDASDYEAAKGLTSGLTVRSSFDDYVKAGLAGQPKVK